MRRNPAANNAAARRAALLVLFAVPFLGGAGENPQRDRNRRQIEAMTATDRARLERNFVHFRELTEPERDRYRLLDRQLREDERAGGKLRELMDGYIDWLATLSPYERETIQREKDPVARAQLVRRMRTEQQQPRAELRPVMASRWREGGWHGLAGLPRLTPEDLDNVIRVVLEESRIPERERAEIDALPPPQRHVRVLLRAFESGAPEGRFRRTNWPDEAVLDKMVAAVDDDGRRRELETALNRQVRKQKMGTMIAGALAAEWRGEMESRRPSEAEIEKYFHELDPSRRDELLELPPDEQRRLLAFGIVSRDNPDLRNLFDVVQRLMPRPFGRGFRPGDRRFDSERRSEPPPDGRPGPPPGGERRDEPRGEKGPPPRGPLRDRRFEGRRAPPPPMN